jgi:hypothetical protein
MALNYALLAVTAILSAAGVINMMRGGPGGHPFRTISAIIVFITVLIATLAGMDYAAFKITIESVFGGQ